MRYLILYNPLAGNGSCQQKLDSLKHKLDKESVLVDMTSIESYGDFISSIDADDVIILAGGDGTINRFINDTNSIDIHNEILYYAAGSGNDFLRDMGSEDGTSPFSIKKYMQDLPTVTVNGKTYRFINGVGYGIDGYCCEVGDKERAKGGDKPINYTAIAIKGLLFHFKRANATVTVDGVTHEYKKVWLAPTMKGRFYGGGMNMAPAQDRLADNGKVSLVLLHGSGKLKTLVVFPSIFKGEHISHSEMVSIHTGHEISVKFDRPCALQVDGETILNVTEYSVKARVPAALSH